MANSREAVDYNEVANAGFRPRLRPRMHPRIQSFLGQKAILFDLVERFGSPLNLIFPQNMNENIADFESIYKKNRQRGRIYFTSKPCKSYALYRETADSSIGIDVSSAGSLQAALDCGWKTDKIGATGPKNKEYISAALQSDVTINIDSIEELQRTVALHGALGKSTKSKITIRISDTGAATRNAIRSEDSAFGINTVEMPWVFEFIKENSGKLDFLGFSYHASMASDDQRIAAMENQFRLTLEAGKHGLKPSIINVGGGFRVSYAESYQEWLDYIDSLKQSVLGKIEPQIWNNSDLGYRVENGIIRGDGAFINHAPVHTKAEELDRWLNFRLPSQGNAKFSDLVRDSLLELCIEPGRSLLDQCGITIGRVLYRKKSLKGENLAGLEMNSTNIHADKFKILTEPIIIPYGDGKQNLDRESLYYMGNLCMSNDMLRYNKTYPDFMPSADDLVVFSNTAAYMMDFMESETLMQPVAKKIALTETNNTWQWQQDKDYRRD